MTDPTERVRALEQFFKGEMLADLELFALTNHAGRLLVGHDRVQQLRDAGLSAQADALLTLLNSVQPQEVAAPALPHPVAPAATNGAPSLPTNKRRGRPPKGSASS